MLAWNHLFGRAFAPIGLALALTVPASAQTICPSGVIGVPDTICVLVTDQITGAQMSFSGAGPVPVVGTVGDYTLALVAGGVPAPAGLGAAVTLSGTVTRTSNSGQPPLNGLAVSVDYGRFGPLPAGAGSLDLTGSGVGTTYTLLAGAVGEGPVGGVAFQSIGNTDIDAFTIAPGGGFDVASGPLPVDAPEAVALNLFTLFIPNQIGDSISIPADSGAGEPVTPGDDPGLVGEIGCQHFKLDELLVQEPNALCPTEHFREDALNPVFSLEGGPVPSFGPCGAGTFEEVNVRRATFLNEPMYIDDWFWVPSGATLVIQEGASFEIGPEGRLVLPSDASLVVQGELINDGLVLSGHESVLSNVGRFENRSFVELAGALNNESQIENLGDLVLCEEGLEKGFGDVSYLPSRFEPICVPEPGAAASLAGGAGALFAVARRRRSTPLAAHPDGSDA